MSGTSPVLYTSETGVESPEPTVVEVVANKKVRMTDPTYGLKTAAKVTRTKVERETFLRQKAEAIGRQHAREAAKKQARIADLDAQIAKIYNALVSGTASDERKSLALYDTLVAKRASIA